MLPIPISTDAPLYYRPLATVGLIAANVSFYVAASRGQLGEPDDWLLTFGQGLHPGEWLLCNFMHGGVIHLLGNMIFLWVFGLIVEGKLGWWRFLGLYLAVCVAFGALMQLLALGYAGESPGGMGASAAIFGLVGIALIWAPSNEVNCVWPFALGLSFRLVHFEMTIGAFAGMYFLWESAQFFLFASFGFSLATAAGHLLGGLVGLALGVLLLRRGLVDCEGWDCFHVWRGAQPSSILAGETPSVPEVDPVAMAEKRRQHAVEAAAQIEFYLARDNLAAALALHEKMAPRLGSLELSEDALKQLIAGLHKQQAWSRLCPLLRQFLERHGDSPQAPRLRLLYADILLRRECRVASALEVLESCDEQALSDKLLETKRRLEQAARRQLKDAELELDDE
jgi:membrane associated rhomboid family serine protease